MIRRKKLTIFTDAKDTTTVLELKKIIEGMFTLNIYIYNSINILFRYSENTSSKSATIQQR